MKRRHTVVALLLMGLMSTPAMAQESWSLVKCIDYAKQQSLDVKRRTNDMKSAEVNLNTAKSSRLPNLSANLNQNLAFGRSLNATNSYVNQSSATTSLGINASAPIYQGSYISSRVKYADWSLKAAMEDINQMGDDITIQVTLAYLQALYNKELVKVAQENVDQGKLQLKKTEELVAGGRLPKSEQYESKAQLAKEEYQLTKAQGDLKLALLALGQLMELPSIESFDVEVPATDKVAINSDAVLALSSGSIEKAYTIRPAVKAAEYRLQASEEYISMAKSAYYPSLSAVASYGNSYYNIFDMPNTSFGTQVKNQGQKVVGLQLNIPIFNRYESRNNVSLARIEQEQRKVSLSDAKKTLFKEMQQAYYNAMTAQQSFLSAKQALEASTVAYQYAQEKFDAGRSTVFEMNETKKRLATSQSELAQARYEYIFRTKLLDYYNGTAITL
jgi:outer membrane protein